MWQELASGTGVDIISAAVHEHKVEEGERARLVVGLKNPIDSQTAEGIVRHLSAKGVEELSVKTSGKTVDISYRKGAAWLAVTIAGIVLLAIVVVSWRFYREMSTSPIGWVAIASISIVAVLVMLFLLKGVKK